MRNSALIGTVLALLLANSLAKPESGKEIEARSIVLKDLNGRKTIQLSGDSRSIVLYDARGHARLELLFDEKSDTALWRLNKPNLGGVGARAVVSGKESASVEVFGDKVEGAAIRVKKGAGGTVETRDKKGNAWIRPVASKKAGD